MKKVIRGIGIDVGFTKENPSGWMVVDFDGNDGWKPTVIAHGMVYPHSPKANWSIRVAQIAEEVAHVCYDYCDVDLLGVEMPFVHKNTNDFQGALKLAAGVGAFFHAFFGLANNMIEVNTMQVKKALTEDGKASKEQMIASAKKRTGLTLEAHEADALGVIFAAVLLAKMIDPKEVRL